MTLVVGATGVLGMEICRRLRAGGQPVRALVRKTSAPQKKESLRQLGAELVEGDLKDRASLDRACSGVAAVITTPTAIGSQTEGDSFETVDRHGQIALIDAAVAAKVTQFVFVSVSGALGNHGPNPLVEAKRAVEEHLKASGLAYTILRPTFFMEIWLGPHLGFDAGNAKAAIYGSGQNKTSYISLNDVAEFAVKAPSNDAGRNTVLELGGPDALSLIDVVKLFEEIGGRTFDLQFVNEEQLRAQKSAAAYPVQQTFADFMLAAARGDEIDMSETVRKFPIRLRSVRDYAKSTLA